MAEFTMSDIERALKTFKEAWGNKPPVPTCLYCSPKMAEQIINKAKELGVYRQDDKSRDWVFNSLMIVRYELPDNAAYVGGVKE